MYIWWYPDVWIFKIFEYLDSWIFDDALCELNRSERVNGRSADIWWPDLLETIPTTLTTKSLDKYIYQFLQIILSIWTNMFRHLDKEILILDKYVLLFRQIHFAILTNMFCNLEKSIQQLRYVMARSARNNFNNFSCEESGEMHFSIWHKYLTTWINIFSKFNKYICNF